MGKGPKSKVGTGGMATKLTAADDCHVSRSGYGHCQRQGFSCDPQDHGRAENMVPYLQETKKKNFILIDYIEKLIYEEMQLLWII